MVPAAALPALAPTTNDGQPGPRHDQRDPDKQDQGTAGIRQDAHGAGGRLAHMVHGIRRRAVLVLSRLRVSSRAPQEQQNGRESETRQMGDPQTHGADILCHTCPQLSLCDLTRLSVLKWIWIYVILATRLGHGPHGMYSFLRITRSARTHLQQRASECRRGLGRTTPFLVRGVNMPTGTRTFARWPVPSVHL
jgi:hypothetical protein